MTPRLTRQRIQTIERALDLLGRLQRPYEPLFNNEPSLTHEKIDSALAWAQARLSKVKSDDLQLFSGKART